MKIAKENFTKFLVFILTIMVTSCASNDTIDSTDVNEEKLHGFYCANFYEDTADLKFFTQFRVGGSTGTTVRMISPSEVRVEGSRMQVRDGDKNPINLIGTYYTLKESVSAPSKLYEFIWTRTDGSTFRNVMTFARAVSVSSPPANFMYKKGDDLTVKFSNSIASGESVTVKIRSNNFSQDGTEKSSISQRVTSGDQVIFTAQELRFFVVGSAKITAERAKRESVQNGHTAEGGEITSYYESSSVPIVVQE